MENKIACSEVPKLTFHTGNTIPQFGLGTHQLQGEDCKTALKIAISKGYRHIDTASIYKNGKEIGEVLKEFFDAKTLSREEVFITSKISPYEQGYEKATQACQKILDELQVSYLDLLLIHWPGVSKMKPESTEIPNIRLDTWKAMEKLKEEGKVKDIGVSNFLVPHLEHLLQNSTSKPVINQFELHPFCYNKELVDFCTQNNIIVEAYSSIAKGDEILMKNEYLVGLSKKYNKTVPQIALKWAIQKSIVIIPKSKTEKYLAENIDLWDFTLSSEEISEIDSLNKNHHICWDPSAVKN